MRKLWNFIRENTEWWIFGVCPTCSTKLHTRFGKCVFCFFDRLDK